MIKLCSEELKLVKGLLQQSRDFFGQTMPYKESFKFYPVPGGYLTPYPGANEIFELRRGLPGCPPELASQAMSAFQLFEKLSKSICQEVGRDIGVDLYSMPSDTSATMRCIHYDEPEKSPGIVDSKKPPGSVLPAGSTVRLIGFGDHRRVFNGAEATVISCDSDGAMVRIQKVAKEVLESVCNSSGVVHVPMAHLRLLRQSIPGVYPAHTDSSLVTLMPLSSAAGLEVKDLDSGEWFPIEEQMEPDEILVIVGDPLDYASSHRYKALMHRPVVPARGGAVPPTMISGRKEHRISTPFFLYPRDEALIAPCGGSLPQLVFDDIQGNINGCRDSFPWKAQSCYYSDLVYS